ncbi:glutathione S-transferase [Mycena floridula]|nr:glutathione S-transferase [Mycena floridula]
MSSALVFYDLISTVPGKAFSPKTWKVRLALNYKAIQYRTVWIEHPDVEATAKQIGAKPTALRPDGRPLYTCPIIVDPNTGSVIADSTAIIEYLDTVYPDSPKLDPIGTLQAGFKLALFSKISPIFQFGYPASVKVLPSLRTKVYFEGRVEEIFGKPVETVLPKGEQWGVEWKKLEEGMHTIASWYLEPDQLFIMGDKIIALDFDIAGFLLWARVVWGADSEQWKEVASWDGGRWGKLLDRLQEYQSTL